MQLCLLVCLGSVLLGTTAAGNHSSKTKPLDIRLFHSLNRAGAPVVSPDGTKALFTQSHYSQDDNKSASFISVLDIATANVQRLTPDTIGLAYANPLWIDDGTFGYMHNGSLYVQPLQEDAAATEVFAPAVRISSVVFRVPGQLIFLASVYPNVTTLAESKEQAATDAARIDKAQVYSNIWVRHWDEWMTPEKPTPFALTLTRPANDNDKWTIGNELNLFRDLPPFTDPLIRWSCEEYAVSNNGTQVAFVVRQPDNLMSTMTNVDVYLVPTDGSQAPRLLTGDVDGIASGPVFSADDRFLAWMQMETPRYESDISRIYVHDIEANTTRSISRDWTLSPIGLLWSADGKQLYAVTNDAGDVPIYTVSVDDGRRERITGHGSVSGLRRAGDNRLVLLHSDQDECNDIHELTVGNTTLRQLTDINSDKLADVYLGPAEDFWFKGARGDRVHGWLVKPAGFDPAKKYPLAYIVHGGPQQANSHAFSYAQWNPNMYASAGFVAAQINFHGSPGYSQNFTDSIQRQWGGYPFEDLMRGLDHLATLGFVDTSRAVALGASYGGYMMNWFNARTKRFRALVNHDGLFATPMFWYSTEELWFPEHDFGGEAYRADARRTYDRFNPECFANDFTTPTLFVHGAEDFRVPLEQSLAPFTLLRRRGIPAKLVYFPNENHWTQHIGNSVRWFTEVLLWISEHTNTTVPYDLSA
ncbi:Dipeptidyl-peptidase 5 [Coemansia spiralis]|nr:Dipeptidyl-peptidase 5 [Coemansia spiralis]